MQCCNTPVLDLYKPTTPTVSVYSRFPESISLVFSKLTLCQKLDLNQQGSLSNHGVQKTHMINFPPLFFWPQGEATLSTPRFYNIHSDTACPQSFSTVRDAGFEPRTTASVVWSATNDPPHLLINTLAINDSTDLDFHPRLRVSQ